MSQRYEHLSGVQLLASHVVLHDRLAASELMLVSETIKDPLRSVPLLGRPLFVLFQNRVDHTNPLAKLRPTDRLLPPIAWRHRVLQHLPSRLSRQPKLPGYRLLTPALNTNRTTYTPVYLHLKHPSGVP